MHDYVCGIWVFLLDSDDSAPKFDEAESKQINVKQNMSWCFFSSNQ